MEYIFQPFQLHCLELLAVVASDWSYDYSKIDAYLDTYMKFNAELESKKPISQKALQSDLIKFD